MLKASSDPINILLVGDGPERATLEILAAKLDVSVHFYGACYDEATLASLIYYSDVTVSRGKIGLTVIHSLTYGTPAITHGDLDQQMPEVEAITDGFNGKLFIKDDVHDLVRCMTEWFSARYDRETVRSQCQQVVAKNWNPARQRELIDKGVTSLLNAR